MLTMLKINVAINHAQIRLNSLSDSQKKALEETLELTPREFVAYQQSKSIAQAEGKIDLETALFIYNSLGNWSKTNLATKVVLTELFLYFLRNK
jgi:hypothetical protein